MAERNRTRAVAIGSVTVGAGSAIVVQSMCATHTQDVAATVEQANALHQAGQHQHQDGGSGDGMLAGKVFYNY